jgi:hypothetical protein
MRGRDVPAAISAAADFAIRDEADPGHPAARELGADSKSPARRSIGGNRQTWPAAVIRNRLAAATRLTSPGRTFPPCYRLLDTMRAYALEKLVQGGAVDVDPPC